MTHEEALQILVNAVAVAQNKGAFTLGDAKVIIQAVEIIKPEIFAKKEENVEEV